MTTDLLWMTAMLVLFAVFLRGLLHEAGAALRAIARDEEAEEWRDDLQNVMAMRSRQRLRAMRATAAPPAFR